MASRGRPRKPVPDLLLEDRYRIDRHGEASSAWLPYGEPVMPDSLSPEARELWESLVPQLTQRGVATAVDTAELTGLCEWWGRYREASATLGEIEDRKSTEYYRIGILAGAFWKNFSTAASRFGLNPSDRAKLRLGVETQEDELLSFANGGRDDQEMDQKRSGRASSG